MEWIWGHGETLSAKCHAHVEDCSTPYSSFKSHVKMTLKMNSNQKSRQVGCHVALCLRISKSPLDAITAMQQRTYSKEMVSNCI